MGMKMDNNNYSAMRSVTPFTKPVTRKMVDVSLRRFTPEQLKRVR